MATALVLVGLGTEKSHIPAYTVVVVAVAVVVVEAVVVVVVAVTVAVDNALAVVVAWGR